LSAVNRTAACGTIELSQGQGTAVVDNGAFTIRANTMKLTVKSLPSRLYKVWLKAWLRVRLDSYTRHLHAIAAQRENDFHAERMLHRAVSATRAKLQSL
jgi:hypothetical protein